MNRLDILIPFALPPAELARDLLRQCQAPALATLLGYGKETASPLTQDPFSRALPHENWLSRHFSLPKNQQDSSPQAATALMRQLGHAPQAGQWFVLQPAHIHVARDHLVLTDIGQLALDEAHARKLFASAQPLFTEIGHEILYGDERTWFLRADAWAGLRTSTPAAASGRNIDIWMPEGPGELAWRKLQNEVQMQWFSESLNDEREMQGLKAVNSMWLWGGADAGTPVATPGNEASYAASHGLAGWPQAFAAHASHATSLPSLIGTDGNGLLLLNQLMEAALAEEWGVWLQQMETLDKQYLSPSLEALRNSQIDTVRLLLSGASKLTQVDTTRGTLRKFWNKPSLKKLAA